MNNKSFRGNPGMIAWNLLQYFDEDRLNIQSRSMYLMFITFWLTTHTDGCRAYAMWRLLRGMRQFRRTGKLYLCYQRGSRLSAYSGDHTNPIAITVLEYWHISINIMTSIACYLCQNISEKDSIQDKSQKNISKLYKSYIENYSLKLGIAQTGEKKSRLSERLCLSSKWGPAGRSPETPRCHLTSKFNSKRDSSRPRA